MPPSTWSANTVLIGYLSYQFLSIVAVWKRKWLNTRFYHVCCGLRSGHGTNRVNLLVCFFGNSLLFFFFTSAISSSVFPIFHFFSSFSLTEITNRTGSGMISKPLNKRSYHWTKLFMLRKRSKKRRRRNVINSNKIRASLRITRKVRLMSSRYVILYDDQEYLSHSAVMVFNEYFEAKSGFSETLCIRKSLAKRLTDCHPQTWYDFIISFLCCYTCLSNDANRTERKDIEQAKSSSA